MVSRNTTLVPSLGLCIGPACEAGLSAGMRRKRVPPRIRKEKRESHPLPKPTMFGRQSVSAFVSTVIMLKK